MVGGCARRLSAHAFPGSDPCWVLSGWEMESPYWPLSWLTGEACFTRR